MNNAFPSGYRKKKIPELLRAIDDCTSLSQLFALIQHEQIEVQMHAQSGASNVKPRKLTTKDIIGNRDFPLDRLKMEVKKAVCGSYVPPTITPAEGELIQKIRDTKTHEQQIIRFFIGYCAAFFTVCPWVRKTGRCDSGTGRRQII